MSIRQQIKEYENLLRKPEIPDPSAVVETPVLQCAMDHPSIGARSGKIDFSFHASKFMFLADWIKEES